jgi:leukotriene-A4 hydrolase
VPYEKGFAFLFFLEELTNTTNFQQILHTYINENQQKSITWETFKETFERVLKSLVSEQEYKKITKSFIWEDILKARGYVKNMLGKENDYSNSYDKQVQNYVDKIVNKKNEPSLKTVFDQWHTSLKARFLYKIQKIVNLDKVKNKYIYEILNEQVFANGYDLKLNAEIQLIWYQIVLVYGQPEDDVFKNIQNYLTTWGRIKYIYPLYLGWSKFNRYSAQEFYNKHKSFYHPIARSQIDRIFKENKEKPKIDKLMQEEF